MKVQKGKDGKLKITVKKGHEKMGIATDKKESKDDCDTEKGKAKAFGNKEN